MSNLPVIPDERFLGMWPDEKYPGYLSDCLRKWNDAQVPNAQGAINGPPGLIELLLSRGRQTLKYE